jgi:uncharacterized membrane protein YkgB
MNIHSLDLRIITWLRRAAMPLARTAIFIVYFFFGILKIFNLSPASPLALALTEKTIGATNFHFAFLVLAIAECIIGILFLFPKATRLVIPLLLIHMVIVCSPLILVPELAWSHPLVPSLEGQYIIKNVVIVALAVGIAAQAHPLKTQTNQSPKQPLDQGRLP